MPAHEVTPIGGPGFALAQGLDHLDCFDVENGAERWRAAVVGRHIVVVDDLVIVGSHGITRALRLIDGARAWTALLAGRQAGQDAGLKRRAFQLGRRRRRRR